MRTFLLLCLLSTAPLLAAGADTGVVVAVIGTGDLGDSLGPRFAALGYTVIYGSREPDSARVKALVEATGASARAATPERAAARADIVVLAVPWPAMRTVAQQLGDLDGKIVIDPSMPFRQGADGYPEHLLETSSAELVQSWNPGARVVKTFGTMGSQIIDDPDEAGGVVSLPIAADDRAARETVARIAAEMGLDPVDFGPLRMARQIENLQMIYMIPLAQNRPEHWEFHFRRSRHYGCYQSHGSTAEGLVPTDDAGNLASFPHDGPAPGPCR